jgi:hypothetical protein
MQLYGQVENESCKASHNDLQNAVLNEEASRETKIQHNYKNGRLHPGTKTSFALMFLYYLLKIYLGYFAGHLERIARKENFNFLHEYHSKSSSQSSIVRQQKFYRRKDYPSTICIVKRNKANGCDESMLYPW